LFEVLFIFMEDKQMQMNDNFPLRFGAYTWAISEVLSPLTSAASFYGVPSSTSRLIFPLRVASVGYVGMKSFSFGYVAGNRELHPDRVRAAQRRAIADSLISGWIECITLPGIFIGAVMSGLTKTSSINAISNGPTKNRLPLAIGIILVPFVLPVSKQLTEAIMDWAFRPTLSFLSQPSSFLVAANPTDYIPPSVDELISSTSTSSGGNNDGILESLMLPSDLDPLSRARFEWAADGDIGSVYPLESDTIESQNDTPSGDSIGSSIKLVNRKNNTSSTFSTTELDYIEAVKRIRERAEKRR
jgi:hypothetical protein